MKNGKEKDKKRSKIEEAIFIGDNIFWLDSISIDLYCGISKWRKEVIVRRSARMAMK